LNTLGGLPPHVAKARDDGFDFTFPAGAPVREDGSTDDGQVSLDFSIVSAVPVGAYEQRETYDEDAEVPGDVYEPDPDDPEARLGGFVQSVNVNEDVTIEVTCDRYNQTAPAYATLARIRDRISLPSSRATLAALGIAVRGTGPIRRVDGAIDGRAVSRYVLELFCNSSSMATEEEYVTTIEHVPLPEHEMTP
jgi:hypothetical protein